MSITPRNPETNQPITSLSEYDLIVRQIADLHPMPPDTPQHTHEVPDPTNDLLIRMEKIMGRVRAKAAAGRTAPEGSMEEREDAWASLGGGHNTYHREGFLPTGIPEKATVVTTRGRGGQLVHRVSLAGKFIDVPVNEHGSNATDIERAKVRLVRGQGVSVAALKRKPRK